MKKTLTLKVTEICSIAKTFLVNSDCPVQTLLLVIAEDDKGETEHIIIPTHEANFQTDSVRVGERYRFICYSYKILLSKYFDGISCSGFLCLKVLEA